MTKVDNSTMRFAIYYAPENNSLLHQLGSQWLGRDAFTGRSLEQPGCGLLNGKTKAATRYGLHATLKAPFRLREGKTQHHILQDARVLATLLAPAQIERLVVGEIDGYVALLPQRPSDEVDALAANSVRCFDHLRQPLGAAELARRHEAGLTSRQSHFLAEWGYPFVFEEFRFHMTLSEKLYGEDRQTIRTLAEQHFSAVNGTSLILDNITVFVETEAGGNFDVLEQLSIGTSTLAVFA
ncbi:MAG: DUF1045 domain-containing protein [Pseudomonadota bacterium]|nr:DUF1045 domain-containing protein [Pseudomonadota bacterium]